jgi:hypothetical protein
MGGPPNYFFQDGGALGHGVVHDKTASGTRYQTSCPSCKGDGSIHEKQRYQCTCKKLGYTVPNGGSDQVCLHQLLRGVQGQEVVVE